MAGPQVKGWFYKLRRSHETSSFARHVTKAWSKRYFVIVRDRIKWYHSADPYSGEAPCGFVNFQQILRIRVLNSESRLEDVFNRDEYGTYSIEIDSRARRLVIRTASRESAKIWVSELRRRMEIWTDRTGAETLREIAKTHSAVDSRDHLVQRIDQTLEQLEAEEASDQYGSTAVDRAVRSSRSLNTARSDGSSIGEKDAELVSSGGTESKQADRRHRKAPKSTTRKSSKRDDGVTTEQDQEQGEGEGLEEEAKSAEPAPPKKRASTRKASARRSSKESEQDFAEHDEIPIDIAASASTKKAKSKRVVKVKTSKPGSSGAEAVSGSPDVAPELPAKARKLKSRPRSAKDDERTSKPPSARPAKWDTDSNAVAASSDSDLESKASEEAKEDCSTPRATPRKPRSTRSKAPEVEAPRPRRSSTNERDGYDGGVKQDDLEDEDDDDLRETLGLRSSPQQAAIPREPSGAAMRGPRHAPSQKASRRPAQRSPIPRTAATTGSTPDPDWLEENWD